MPNVAQSLMQSGRDQRASNRRRSYVDRYRGDEAFKQGMKAQVGALWKELGRRWTPHERMVSGVFFVTLGRLPDIGALVEFSKYERPTDIAKLIAESPEGIARGLDSRRYGAKAVDPAVIPADLVPYYDVWREVNGPDAVFTDTTLSTLRMYQDGGSPQYMEAELRGEIEGTAVKDDDGNWRQVSIVTPEAMQTMGGTFTGNANDPGDVVYLPEGAEARSGNSAEWDKAGTTTIDGRQYRAYGASGNLTGGLLEEIGIDANDLPDWVGPVLYFGGSGVADSIAGGGKMSRDTQRQLGDHLGRDFDKYWSGAHAIAASVVDTVVFEGYPLVSTAYNTLRAVGLHSANPNVDLSDALTRVAISAAFQGAGGGAVGAALATKLTGGSWEEAGESALWSMGSSAFGGLTGGHGLASTAARLGFDLWAADQRGGKSDTALVIAQSLAQSGARESSDRSKQGGNNWDQTVNMFEAAGDPGNWLTPWGGFKGSMKAKYDVYGNELDLAMQEK